MRYLHEVYPDATYRYVPYTGHFGATRSGYGKRLPMNYMVRIGKRLYRMRCICFSNAGTPWVRVRGEQLFFVHCYHKQEV
ncbi:MAG: hypothetical protein EBT15_11995 [Betaproteobacteria bacterium]|nr:hypothetical protein [Betaproteobacteria bacterium]